jgi:hypothetical protein
MLPGQLEQAAEDNRHQWDGSVVRPIFLSQWRLVTLGGFVVGMSPVPDGSIVLSMKLANRALHALFRYVSRPTERRGPIPFSVLVPKTGRPGVTYWLLDDPSHCRALMWYAVLNTQDLSREFANLLADGVPVTRAVIGQVLNLWMPVAHIEGQDVPLWPSTYWENIGSEDVLIKHVAPDPGGVGAGNVDQDNVPLSQLSPPWAHRLTRGNVLGGWHNMFTEAYTRQDED